ncbi:MAG: type II toxin-antitoxin system VapC family toxin [Bacteroidota bacterium]
MASFLIDTDICISFLKMEYNLAQKIDSVGLDNCFVSEITIAELAYGAYNSNRVEFHLKEVKRIRRLFNIKSIYSALDLYGKERARLKKQGLLLPDMDIFIATTAVSNDMTLVTNNTKHFTRIEHIKLENWQKSKHNAFI